MAKQMRTVAKSLSVHWGGRAISAFFLKSTTETGSAIVSGINPYASIYRLKPNEVFRTPDFYFTYSFNGKGEASRNFHDWARNYQVKDGNKDRTGIA